MFPKNVKKTKQNDFHVLMRKFPVEASNELRATMLCSILIPYMRQQFQATSENYSEVRKQMSDIAMECIKTRFVDSRLLSKINDVVSMEIHTHKKLKNVVIRDFLKRLDASTIKATESLGLEITENLEEIVEKEKEVTTWEEQNIDGENGTSEFVETCYMECCAVLRKFLPDQYKRSLDLDL